MRQFIQSGKIAYIVMRQSDWQSEFSDLPLTLQATDASWKKSRLNKDKIDQLLKDGIKPHLSEYSENYVLLKVENKG